jgi:predicted GNAT family acetyltransferase
MVSVDQGGVADGQGATGRVIDNAVRSRFELELGGDMAVLDYTRRGQVLALDYAAVPAAFEGRGVGSRLVAEALELVRSRGERVIPRCSFVVAYMHRHREFDDLRADV